jgi:hypothetical protein
MKNIYDVLRQKEAELQQIQKEIEALRVAARLLAEEGDPRAESVMRPAVVPSPPESVSRSKQASPVFDAGSRQFP